MRKRPTRRPDVERLEERLCLASPVASPGSPAPLPSGRWTTTPFVSAPIFSDLDGDGRDELITAVTGARLVAYSASFQGAPTATRFYETGSFEAEIQSTPIVIQRRRQNPIIVAALGRDNLTPSFVADANDAGKVYAWDAITGRILPGWPVSSGRSVSTADIGGIEARAGVIGPLTSGDLDGDGVPEIVVSSFPGFVSAFKLDGSLLWRFKLDGESLSGPVIGDLDRDSRPEVIVGSESNGGLFGRDGGFVNILNNAGSLQRRISLGEAVWSSPSLGDINDDGFLDIIVGTGYKFATVAETPEARAAARAEGNLLHAFNFLGQELPGWPYRTTDDNVLLRQTYPAPALADMNRDGSLEVVIQDRGGFTHVIRGDGRTLTGFEDGRSIFAGLGVGENFASPILGDIDGDGLTDVVSPTIVNLTGFSGEGEIIFTDANFPDAQLSASAIGQFDGSEGFELAAVQYAIEPPNQPRALKIFRLDLNSVVPPWPMHRRFADGRAVSYSPIFADVYVRQVFRALFGREPRAEDLSTGVDSLVSNSLDYFQYARLLSLSPNVILNRPIVDVYGAAFGIGARIPLDSAIAIEVDLNNGRPYREVVADILGSNGNYASVTRSASLVRTVYRESLDREATPAETADALALLRSGVSFELIAENILKGEAARIRYVQDQTLRFLRRSITTAEAALQIGFENRQEFLVRLLSGDGYARRVGRSGAAYARALHRDLLGLNSVPRKELNQAIRILRGQAGQAGRAALVSSLLKSRRFAESFAVDAIFRIIPDESLGILRTGNLSPRTAARPSNPDPALVAIVADQVRAGDALETVLARLHASPAGLSKADYQRGLFRGRGIRF